LTIATIQGKIKERVRGAFKEILRKTDVSRISKRCIDSLTLLIFLDVRLE
jgi:hypothetical protein